MVNHRNDLNLKSGSRFNQNFGSFRISSIAKKILRFSQILILAIIMRLWILLDLGFYRNNKVCLQEKKNRGTIIILAQKDFTTLMKFWESSRAISKLKFYMSMANMVNLTWSETFQGKSSILIKRNTALPIKWTQILKTKGKLSFTQLEKKQKVIKWGKK